MPSVLAVPWMPSAACSETPLPGQGQRPGLVAGVMRVVVLASEEVACWQALQRDRARRPVPRGGMSASRR